MSRALVIGGTGGIGRAIALKLLSGGAEHVSIAGRHEEGMKDLPADRTSFYPVDLNAEDYGVFDDIRDIDTLVITAGFGRIAPFESLTECEIKNLVKCNELAAIQIIRRYYDNLRSDARFDCAVISSIAGHVVSPLYSVYGAAKAGLSMFIENVNAELAAKGYENRILDCSPGYIKGTAFHGGQNDMPSLEALAGEIVSRMQRRVTLYIPDYDEVYEGVLKRYRDDPVSFGLESYAYKMDRGAVSDKPQVVVGYLSGTFDLFHIGHLNLIRRAKAQCDYLIVGVHESGSWKGKETFIPFEERKAIVASVRYVDRVVTSFTEDTDAWEAYHFDKLFVGSDYKGSERFQRYEKVFAGKGVEIVYFPYTKTTSSTQLRGAISVSQQDGKR